LFEPRNAAPIPKEDTMSDELEKKSVGENDEGNEDVEAHKFAIGKTSVGATDDDEKTSIG
jgi:hypothetical protein